MPTYEYVCTSCGHRLEAVQSFSDPALTTCPVCQGALRKVFGNVGIVLKGSGFYKNDSRSTGRPNGSGAPPKEPKEKEKESTGSSTSSDTVTKDSASTKSAPTSTGSSDGSGSSGSSEKAAASST